MIEPGFSPAALSPSGGWFAMPKPKQWKYDLHPSVRMLSSIVAGMKQKTGRSLDEWLAFVKKSGPAGEKERRDWLRKEHETGNQLRVLDRRAFGRQGRSRRPAGIPETRPRLRRPHVRRAQRAPAGDLRRHPDLRQDAGQRHWHLALSDHRAHLP